MNKMITQKYTHKYKYTKICIGHAIIHITKQPNLKLKTQPEQLLGSLPLAFMLPTVG